MTISRKVISLPAVPPIYIEKDHLRKDTPIGIIGGAGVIGSYMLVLLRSLGYTNLYFLDQDTEKTTKFENENIDIKRVSRIELTKNCKVVVVSVPPKQYKTIFEEIEPLLNPEHTIIHCNSIQEPLKDLFERLSKITKNLFGIHLMVAPDPKNLEMIGYNVAVVPFKSQICTKAILNLFSETKANVVALTVDQHDQTSSAIQALVHLSLYMFRHIQTTLFKNDNPDEGFIQSNDPHSALPIMLLARLLGTRNHEMYGMILMDNPFVEQIIEMYLGVLATLRNTINQEDTVTFENTADILSKYYGKGHLDLAKNNFEVISKDVNLLNHDENSGESPNTEPIPIQILANLNTFLFGSVLRYVRKKYKTSLQDLECVGSPLFKILEIQLGEQLGGGGSSFFKVLQKNKDSALKMLDAYSSQLNDLLQVVKNKDESGFKDFFNELASSYGDDLLSVEGAKAAKVIKTFGMLPTGKKQIDKANDELLAKIDDLAEGLEEEYKLSDYLSDRDLLASIESKKSRRKKAATENHNASKSRDEVSRETTEVAWERYVASAIKLKNTIQLIMYGIDRNMKKQKLERTKLLLVELLKTINKNPSNKTSVSPNVSKIKGLIGDLNQQSLQIGEFTSKLGAEDAAKVESTLP